MTSVPIGGALAEIAEIRRRFCGAKPELLGALKTAPENAGIHRKFCSAKAERRLASNRPAERAERAETH